MLQEQIKEFKLYCNELTRSFPFEKLEEDEYIAAVRMMFRQMSSQIKVICNNFPEVEHLSSSLKEIAWDTLEKYRNNYIYRK